MAGFECGSGIPFISGKTTSTLEFAALQIRRVYLNKYIKI